MKIGGLTTLTLLDYPGKVACSVFTSGCNFRCPFCHNAGLVDGAEEQLSEQAVLTFLQKRKGVLEGVCLTGGEPLLWDVKPFLSKVKQLGYCVKLDTNGSFPDKLASLIGDGLVDYVAMDVKNCKRLYAQTVGASVDLDKIQRSLDLLLSGVVPYELRTTVTDAHDEKAMEELARWIASDSAYFMQKFVNNGRLVDNNVKGVDDARMEALRQVVLPFLPNAQLRGL